MLKKIQTVNFDPTNKEHRAAVRAFLKRNAWNDAGFRFSHDPAYDSVVEQVQSKLLQYYFAKDLDKAKRVMAEPREMIRTTPLHPLLIVAGAK